jgi:MFS superfamily sulfate permease-like transporter
MSGATSTMWGSGAGGASLRPDPVPDEVPHDLSALVPAPRREIVPDRAEPLDVRLHAPTPDTVVVRVIGAVHPLSCAALVTRVRQQLQRAPHVILDLSSVTCLDPQVAPDLRALHAMAVDCGTHLHIAVENEQVCDRLHRLDLGERVVAGTADAVLAGLARRNG